MNALPFPWGWHLTRSRLAQEPVSGKATWFAIPLADSAVQPEPLNLTVDLAAQALHHQLAARGIPDLRLEHGFNRWLVSLPSGVTVWSETPSTFRWPAAEGGHHTRPTSELIEVAETAVRLHEESIVNQHASSTRMSATDPRRPL